MSAEKRTAAERARDERESQVADMLAGRDQRHEGGGKVLAGLAQRLREERMRSIEDRFFGSDGRQDAAPTARDGNLAELRRRDMLDRLTGRKGR